MLVCTGLSGLIFVICGLAFDGQFLSFLGNIVNFSQEEGVFSLRELMALPSSVSAVSYVLRNPDGASLASSFVSDTAIDILRWVIEDVKWGAIIFAAVTLGCRAKLLRDAEIVAIIVVVITNLGTWVGGYSFILYSALVPVFLNMKGRWYYLGVLSLVSIPLDIIPIVGETLGVQYSYVVDEFVEIYWTLGAGSLVRPVVNLALLVLTSREVLLQSRRNFGVGSKGISEFLLSNGCNLRSRGGHA